MPINTTGAEHTSKVDRIHKPSPPPVQVRLVRVKERGRFDRSAALLVGLVLVLTVLVAGGIYTQIFGVVFPTGSAPTSTTAPSATPTSTSAPSLTPAATAAPTPLPSVAPTAASTPTPAPTLSPVPTVAPTPNASGTYTVKAQDNLFGICKAFYGKYTEAYKQLIIQANVAKYPSIAPDGILRVGWVLTIPPKP